LRAIAREAGISTTGLNKAALIEAILEGDEEE
jgi:AcrR family transcriptional regulator